jgi:hypothetical protein
MRREQPPRCAAIRSAVRKDEAESAWGRSEERLLAVSCQATGLAPAARRRVAIRRLRPSGPAGQRPASACWACVGLSVMALVANGLFRCASDAAICGTALDVCVVSLPSLGGVGDHVHTRVIGPVKIAHARAARQLSAVPRYFPHVRTC